MISPIPPIPNDAIAKPPIYAASAIESELLYPNPTNRTGIKLCAIASSLSSVFPNIVLIASAVSVSTVDIAFSVSEGLTVCHKCCTRIVPPQLTFSKCLYCDFPNLSVAWYTLATVSVSILAISVMTYLSLPMGIPPTFRPSVVCIP